MIQVGNQVFKNSLIPRNIEYTALDFNQRLTRLQELLRQQKVDALMIICGNFGENNPESIKFMNWLFKGQTGHNLYYSSIDDPAYEGSLIVVGQNELNVYLEKGLGKIRHLLLGVANCTVFMGTEEELNDQDHLENLKLREFYRFLHHHSTVGVMLDPMGENQEVRSIEQWPIIQAYGLDGIGGGFFTQIHQTVNLTKIINEVLFQSIDGMAAKIILRIQSKKVINNLNLVLQTIEETESKKKSSELEQSNLSLLFAETFEIEELSRSNQMHLSLPVSSVRFGTHTSTEIFYKPKPKLPRVIGKQPIDQTPPQLPPKSVLIDSSHVKSKPALHFVIENVEPISMVRCARTYFLTSNAPKILEARSVNNFAGYVSSYLLGEKKDPLFADEYKLTSIYFKILQTYFKLTKSLKSITKAEIVEKARLAMLNKIYQLNQKLHKFSQEESATKSTEKVVIDVKFYTLLGQEVELNQVIGTDSSKEGSKTDLSQYVINIRVTVSSIKSVAAPGLRQQIEVLDGITAEDIEDMMGSITVADSFLFSKSGFYRNLTSDVPYFDFFEARTSYSLPIREMKEMYTDSVFGKRISKNCGEIELYIPIIPWLSQTNSEDSQSVSAIEQIERIDFPAFHCTASYFEQALKFDSEKAGAFILHFSQIQEAFFLRKNLDKPWVLLKLRKNEPIFFPKLCQNLICLRFSKEALLSIYVDLKSRLETFGVAPVSGDTKQTSSYSRPYRAVQLETQPQDDDSDLIISCKDITLFPDFMKQSLSLRALDIPFENLTNTVSSKYAMQTKEATSVEKNQKKLFNIEVEQQFERVISTDQTYEYLTENSQGSITYEDGIVLISAEDDQDNFLKSKKMVELHPEKVDVVCVVGPLASSKRGFLDSIRDQKDELNLPPGSELLILDYTEDNIIELNTNDFIKILEGSVGQEEGQVKPGLGLIIIAIPHSVDHLEVIKHVDSSTILRLRSVAVKLNLCDQFTKNFKSVLNLNLFLLRGFSKVCFVDTENVDKKLVNSKLEFFKDAFIHVEFEKIEGNSVTLKQLSRLVTTEYFLRPEAKIWRSVSKKVYNFGFEYLFVPYRLPILRDKLKMLRDIMSN